MIQIFGTAKCRGTQKAIRFFKDRNITIQFRDIAVKAPSPGELDDMAKAVGGGAVLIDTDGPVAKARGLAYLDYDPLDEILRDPLLLKTPIVRAGKGRAVVGVDERAWKTLPE